MTFDDVRAIALALPGAEESTSYGTPAFKVGGKMLARKHQDGVSLVVRISFDEREMLMEAEPETFYITDHYRNYPALLVRIETVNPGTLKRILEQTWRQVAPKKLVAAFGAG
ncbi:MAG: MmcQ/YjbR family DNA-binding protein [Caulobacteraceae bacterium]